MQKHPTEQLSGYLNDGGRNLLELQMQHSWNQSIIREKLTLYRDDELSTHIYNFTSELTLYFNIHHFITSFVKLIA